MEGNLLLSVIITAYNRKMFVKDALDSIVNQSCDLNLIEIILVTNFDLDYIPSKPIKIIKVKKEGSIGEFLEEGIKRSNGIYIAFLDDDDLWDKNHASRIIEIFNNNPDVIFYHNRVIYINENGSIINYKRLIDSNNIILKENIVLPNNSNNIKKLLSNGVDFNLSSISIRKSIIENKLDLLSKITTGPDSFFLWIAISLQKGIYIDDLKLTYYRIYKLNTSIIYELTTEKNLLNKSDWLGRMLNTYIILINYFNTLPIENKNCYLDWLNLLYVEYYHLKIIFGAYPKKEIFKNLLKLINFPLNMFYSFRYRIIIFSILYLFSKKITINIYKNLIKI